MNISFIKDISHSRNICDKAYIQSTSHQTELWWFPNRFPKLSTSLSLLRSQQTTISHSMI